LAVWCVNSIATVSVHAQEINHTGRPLWQAFDSRVTNAGETTYSSVINSKGLVYAANEAGLLSYDGVSWRLLPHTPQSRGITHLAALDKEPWATGSWLTGGTNGLGLYTPDDRGRLHWSALDMPGSPGDTPGSPGTPAAASSPIIKNLMTVKDTIYILSDAGVYTFGADGVSTAYEYVLSGAPTGFAYAHNDGIVFEVDNGLLHLNNERYSALTVPPRWSELTPIAVFDNADLGPLLMTQRSGMFTLKTSDNDITLSPLWDELPPPLDTSTVLAGAATHNGGLIFGTDDGALLHFSLSGRLLTRLDSRAGLHAGPIRTISAGASGNIFAFFDGGAVWFNTNDPLRVWDILNGLEKPVTAVAVDSDRVYAGTTAGLYQSVSNGRMRLITELGDAHIRSLDVFQRSSMRGHTSLIVGTGNGLVDYSASGVTTLFEDPPTAVFISRTQPSRLAAGFGTRAYLFDFDRGEWMEAGPIGTQFKSPISGFTETADGDLLIVLNDGTLTAFAADKWLNNRNLERIKPLWTQESPRHMGFDATPHFSATPESLRLFMTGAALLWDYKNEKFQTDTSIATEFSKRAAAEFPRWYATEQAAEALWLQTSTGSYALLETGPETVPETGPAPPMPLIALPAPTRGTASSSAIEYDRRTDRLLFATPDGLTSYPRQFLLAQQPSRIAQQSELPLPALHIRKIAVDGQPLYYGDGPQPQIPIRSTRAEVLVEFAVLDWHTTCGDERMMVESDAHPNIKVAVAPDCTAAFEIADFETQKTGLNLRLAVDGQAVTQDAHLNIKVNRPLISSPLLPLGLGIAIGLWVLFNRVAAQQPSRLAAQQPSRLAAQQPWPEPLQRYTALAAGLFVLLAIAQVLGVITPPGSFLSAIAVWLMVLFAAFIVPVFAEGVLRAGDRLKTWKA
jgi:hypothetical protein